MHSPLLRRWVAAASAGIVLTAAALSSSPRWNFDFAQYRGPDRAEPTDEFRFVMVGDRNGGRVPGLMPQAFREINHLYPDFVVSVGDLIDGPTRDNEKITQLWKEFDDEVALLKSPFVYVPGNHDVWNPTSKGIYEARYGPTYRSFSYRGLHFISLDTEEMDEQGRKNDRIDGKQLEWLREDLARNRDARHILVLMHKPLWLSHGLDQAEPLWAGLPVSVFAGHEHRYSYQEINGIPHVILGAIAGAMREEGDALGRFRHYVLATVRDKEIKLALIRLGGVMSPDVVLEDELPGIRLLPDACALYAEGEAGATKMRLAFRNPLTRPVQLELEQASAAPRALARPPLWRWQAESLAAGELLNRPLDAPAQAASAGQGAGREYRAVFRFTNGRGESEALDFSIEPRTVRSLSAAPAPRELSIDGDLSEWKESHWQDISAAEQITLGPASWKGAADLSARFAVSYDAANACFGVRVEDDHVAFHTAITEGDGVELYLAAPGNGEISFPGDKDWHRLVVAPFSAAGTSPGETAGPARVQQYGAQPLTVRAAYRRDDKGYCIELAMPLRELGWSDRGDAQNQLDVAVNDRDLGPRREKQLAWSGTERDPFASRYYGRLRFAAP